MVKTYSLKVDGEMQLSPHFKVKEFRCKDGTDTILIDDNLIKILEMIREHFGKPITVNSGYRTEAYNKKCGGAPGSLHLKGMAADIVIPGVDPLDVCRFAEAKGVKGIGWYIGSGFTHVDTRTWRYYWKQLKSGQPYIEVKTFLPTLRKGDKGKDVEELQAILNKFGANLKVDGDFGAKTEAAVLKIQIAHKLAADGMVGPKTWAVLV